MPRREVFLGASGTYLEAAAANLDQVILSLRHPARLINMPFSSGINPSDITYRINIYAEICICLLHYCIGLVLLSPKNTRNQTTCSMLMLSCVSFVFHDLLRATTVTVTAVTRGCNGYRKGLHVLFSADSSQLLSNATI